MASGSDSDIDDIRKGWMDHKVLFFRDQHITIEERIAFGARFGELEIHPFANGREGYLEIVRIESDAERQYAADNCPSDLSDCTTTGFQRITDPSPSSPLPSRIRAQDHPHIMRTVAARRRLRPHVTRPPSVVGSRSPTRLSGYRLGS
jgi:alpha-ketoglutarate-dependent taurine dioxygenase